MTTSESRLVDDIVADLVEVVRNEGDYRAFKLAIEWPSVAALVAELVAVKGEHVPPPLRRARQAVAGQPPTLDTRYWAEKAERGINSRGH